MKKGGADDLDNYRPISLLSQLHKLLARILLQRALRSVEFNTEQVDYRNGCSTFNPV